MSLTHYIGSFFTRKVALLVFWIKISELRDRKVLSFTRRGPLFLTKDLCLKRTWNNFATIYHFINIYDYVIGKLTVQVSFRHGLCSMVIIRISLSKKQYQHNLEFLWVFCFKILSHEVNIIILHRHITFSFRIFLDVKCIQVYLPFIWRQFTVSVIKFGSQRSPFLSQQLASTVQISFQLQRGDKFELAASFVSAKLPHSFNWHHSADDFGRFLNFICKRII